jgi:hypothetical protein
MAVYKFKTNSLKTPLKYSSFLAGNDAYVPLAYDSIATSTVGSGGVSSVTFSSIPATYTHLQVRFFAQTNRATYGRDGLYLRFNSDSATNYSFHILTGDGDGVAAGAEINTDKIYLPEVGTTTAGASFFGSGIVDVLDYVNTSKYKTTRSIGGGDHNGTVAAIGAQVSLRSGGWRSTSAINSITFYPGSGTTISQYSKFALYGIKGA